MTRRDQSTYLAHSNTTHLIEESGRHPAISSRLRDRRLRDAFESAQNAYDIELY